VSSVAHVPSVPRLDHHGRVTQARVGRSEWTKLRSVRSTRYSLAAAVLFTIGLAALACAVVAHHYPNMSPRDQADFHPLEVTLVGVQLAQLAIGILGILVITGEYSRTPAWESRPVTVGAKVVKPTPIFTKLDPAIVDDELARLAEPGA